MTFRLGHEILNNSWLYLYKVITLCNHSLEQLEAHQSLLSKEKYASYKAEVRALRAIYYWYLLDLFARVPIITSTAESMKEIQQSDRSEVFEFVVADLQEALPDLKYANSVSPEKSMLMTTGQTTSILTVRKSCFLSMGRL